MLKASAFSHAATIMMVFVYVLCRLLAVTSPQFLRFVGQSWFHSFDLSGLPVVTGNAFEFIFGLITAAGLTWIFTYSTVWLYNKLAK